MTALKVRRVRFDFASDDVPFNWQPERPAFAMLCNVMTFMAIPFEAFIVASMREAIPLMTDAAAVEDGTAFMRQEAQHSASHISHFRAMVARWPGLQETMDEITASYEHLTATRPLEWRLAYTAGLENTFTPYFKVFLDHDDKLFAPGDERVASLFLWHFVEEIEHRSSALGAYDAISGDYGYRLKVLPELARHVGEVLAITINGFTKHVPPQDGGEFAQLMPAGISPRAFVRSMKATRELKRRHPGLLDMYVGVPKREMLAMMVGLVRCQARGHDPADEKLPPFAARWTAGFEQNPKVAARWYTNAVSHS